MSAPFTKEQLLEVWRRNLDPSYTEPLETEDDGRGFDMIAGLAAALERVSTAVMVSTQAMYLKSHSRQLAPPASGGVVATGQVAIYRDYILGGDLPLDDGDKIVALFTDPDGGEQDYPEFEVVGDASIPAGSVGPTMVNVRCSRPGFQGNVPPGTPGKFPEARGGEFSVVSFDSGTAIVTIDPDAGDRFLPTMRGMAWRFTSGPNLGAFARRIVQVISSTTAEIDFAGDLVTQGAGTGELVDLQTVLNARIVFVTGTSGGRSAELDMLARERTAFGRSVGESDPQLVARLGTLPEIITPNNLIRAIAAVLDPFGVPFDFVEVFDDGVGFFFDDGTDVVDSAYDDPYAYREHAFYVGDVLSAMVPRGFIVVLNGLALPVEPGLTQLLAALTAAIISTKMGGMPWAIAFEPPIP